MTENVENLVLEQLKAIRAEQSAARDRDVELIRRVSGLESMVARLGPKQASAIIE